MVVPEKFTKLLEGNKLVHSQLKGLNIAAEVTVGDPEITIPRGVLSLARVGSGRPARHQAFSNPRSLLYVSFVTKRLRKLAPSLLVHFGYSFHPHPVIWQR